MNDDETNGNAAERVIPARASGSFPVPRNPLVAPDRQSVFRC